MTESWKMKPMVTGFTLSSRNVTGIWLLMLAAITITFCWGCEVRRDVRIGAPAPAFSATDIIGQQVNPDQLKGKVVVLYFWRDSCCGENLKLIESLYKANRDRGLEILAVNVGDRQEAVKGYAQNNRLTFTMLTDEHSIIFTRYQVLGFPTVFIIDGNGVIREKILGEIQADKLEKLIQRQFEIRKQAQAAYEKSRSR